MLKKFIKHFSKFFSHPAILILIGGYLSTIILPGIISDTTKRENAHKDQIETAIKFIDGDMEMNKDFNSILTSMELFHRHYSPRYFNDEQKELRSSTKELYLKFNNNVWWWDWKLFEKVKIEKMIPHSEEDYVTSQLSDYSDNWRKVTDSLKVVWKICIDENYNPADTSNRKQMDIQIDGLRKFYDRSREFRDSKIRAILSKLSIE